MDRRGSLNFIGRSIYGPGPRRSGVLRTTADGAPEGEPAGL